MMMEAVICPRPRKRKLGNLYMVRTDLLMITIRKDDTPYKIAEVTRLKRVTAMIEIESGDSSTYFCTSRTVCYV